MAKESGGERLDIKAYNEKSKLIVHINSRGSLERERQSCQ